MSKQPIGIFDSGVGGTSIWKEIQLLLPNENTIYLADSSNAPYGTKTKQQIIDLSIKNTEFLLNKGSKLIVVACNTATTNAIKLLRSAFDVPFIGIEPAIKPASLNTHTKAVGILATKGTLSSELFHTTTNLYSNGINVIEQVGDGIVELIESGKMDSEEMEALLKGYLQPMIDANIDYLVLGCTHYPYLMPLLLQILPKSVKIIDSGAAVARQTKAILQQHHLLNTEPTKTSYDFYTTGTPQVMESLLGENYKVQHISL
ncbi:glutamate racemase [Mangrovimonas sp. DI 80]|uniref:glutamate racemase n=1 Tax=Mangrovimonas sp. DI 80 TaxID=1779330 RepID=UPI00097816C4|nr:glutamate racemase [Mangrovimonas sp. DI 80]OMP31392.1 glutamate racemase [Mangrovimonas sp. DI 80]